MSKILEVLSYADKSITNKLTDFCWWTDIHFNKNNLWMSRKSFVWVFTLACIFRASDQIKIEDNLIYCLSVTLFFMLISFMFNSLWIILSKNVRTFFYMVSNAKVSPNRNRENSEMFSIKIGVIILLVIFPSIFNEFWLYYFFANIALLLSLYFLCTEPLPPAVKRKKLEEKSFGKLQTITLNH